MRIKLFHLTRVAEALSNSKGRKIDTSKIVVSRNINKISKVKTSIDDISQS